MRDADLARKVGEFADKEETPSEERVEGIIKSGYWQHTFIRPKVFTYSLFPIWWAASWVNAKPEERLWEKVSVLPSCSRVTIAANSSNVQAALGRAGLRRLPEFIERTRRHARILDELLGDVPGINIPVIPEGRTHVYYQYCPYVPDHETLVKRCIRRGVDVAPMHVDVCTRMELFGWNGAAAPGADKAATSVQVPVYESLSDGEVERVGRLVREQVMKLRQAGAA
ncbi:MAG: DegT/DnrJ/EryC1/StrS family aminotransferase [Vicinamibacterales bacterium]